MTPRTLIADTPGKIGEKVMLEGWVHIRRDHGKLIFIDLRDRSGIVQAVVIPDYEAAHTAAKDVRSEHIVSIVGMVKARPGGAGNDKLSTGGVEIEVEELHPIAAPESELPLDVSQAELDVQLRTLLDHRTLSLRHAKVRAIFGVASEIFRAYDEVMRADGFVEIKTPKILDSATEGGANFFKIKYFDRDAFLAQSPQFYKQAGMSVFERVFEIGPVFRAEPHFTSRHVNEYTGLDAEMGFIGSVEDVMAELERAMRHLFRSVGERCAAELALHDATVPDEAPIPRIRLSEALEILRKEYGKEVENEDIDGEGERMICEYAKKEHGSDLVFLTHYPTALRPFYSMPSADDPTYTETFDLLFRGVEIASGGQRIHDPKMLAESIRKRGLDPDDFKHYIDIFRYGAPPHGGWGLGSERIVQKILGLKSIKEAVLYPRDVRRLAP